MSLSGCRRRGRGRQKVAVRETRVLEGCAEAMRDRGVLFEGLKELLPCRRGMGWRVVQRQGERVCCDWRGVSEGVSSNSQVFPFMKNLTHLHAGSAPGSSS